MKGYSETGSSMAARSRIKSSHPLRVSAEGEPSLPALPTSHLQYETKRFSKRHLSKAERDAVRSTLEYGYFCSAVKLSLTSGCICLCWTCQLNKRRTACVVHRKRSAVDLKTVLFTGHLHLSMCRSSLHRALISFGVCFIYFFVFRPEARDRCRMQILHGEGLVMTACSVLNAERRGTDVVK